MSSPRTLVVTGGTYHDFATAERWIRSILSDPLPIEAGGYGQLADLIAMLRDGAP